MIQYKIDSNKKNKDQIWHKNKLNIKGLNKIKRIKIKFDIKIN